MATRLAIVALCLTGVTAQAHADDNMSRLESCIQAARLADAICAKITTDPAQRGDCFAKGRAAQLECLDRVLSEVPAPPGSPGSASETARPEPPVETAQPKAPVERPASSETGRTDRPDVSVGSTAADQATELSNAAPEPAPAASLPPPPPAAEAPTGAIPSDSENKNVKTASETQWIVSETTSPVDYSPLVSAVLNSTSNVENGPNTLTVRCRAQHTELSIRTDGAWGVPRGNDVLVDYQISGLPVVRQPWLLSADGKTATYKNDSVELLRSIPDGATLKIAVTDRGNVRLAATFEPSGLAGIRQKVGAACKWAPPDAKTSSEQPAPKAVFPRAPMRARQGRM